MVKRKADESLVSSGAVGKKRALNRDSDVKESFRTGLFDPAVLNDYTTKYAKSQP